MLIAHAPPFIFLHVDKAAGSSIQAALVRYAERPRNSRMRRKLVWLGSLNRVTRFYRVLEFPEHVTAATVRRCLPPELYAMAFKFAFVRNPYDRMVSRYAYLVNYTPHRDHRRVTRMSFEEFIQWEAQRNTISQHRFVADARGRLIVDFVGHYERLSHDFGVVCSRLGLTAELPVSNVSGHSDYRTYYSLRARELVARYCAFDLELFGYDFEGLRNE